MFTVGEFGNTIIVNSKKSTLEFEKYCRDEGLSSIQLKREVCKAYNNKRNEFFKSILDLVKEYIKR